MLQTIITAGVALIGGLILLLVTVRIKRRETREVKRRETREELRTLIDSIIAEGGINASALDLKLRNLKEFFLRNEKLRKKNEAFFEEWLLEIPMDAPSRGMTTGSHWTGERIRELVDDLTELRETNCQ